MASVNRRLAWALGVAIFVVLALDIVALVSEPRDDGTALPSPSPTVDFFPSPSPELSPTIDTPTSPGVEQSPDPTESPDPTDTSTPAPTPEPTGEPKGIATTGAGFLAAWPALGLLPLIAGSAGLLFGRRKRVRA